MMRPLRFNFAPNRGRPYLSYAFLAAALVLASYVGWLYVTAVAAQRSADAQLARLAIASSSGPHRSAGARTAGPELSNDLAYERGVSDRLSVPWDALFKEIELSVDSEVVLLAVNSNTGQGTVSFIAEARSLTAMIAYARRLRAGNLLHEVEIKNHKVIVQDSLRPVRFVINTRLRLRPPAHTVASGQPE